MPVKPSIRRDSLPFAIILADINSKYAGQAFNPSRLTGSKTCFCCYNDNGYKTIGVQDAVIMPRDVLGRRRHKIREMLVQAEIWCTFLVIFEKETCRYCLLSSLPSFIHSHLVVSLAALLPVKAKL